MGNKKGCDHWRRDRGFVGGVEIQDARISTTLSCSNLKSEIGGTSQSSEGQPVGYPWGAHYLPVPFQENTELISLLDEMSLHRWTRSDTARWSSKNSFSAASPRNAFSTKAVGTKGFICTSVRAKMTSGSLRSFKNRSIVG